MYRDKFSTLGVRTLGFKLSDPLASLRQLEDMIGVPLFGDYRAMLLEYAAPIVFDEANSYKPLQASPYSRRDGTQSIDILYGLGPGENGLIAMFSTYSGRIPKLVLPIGAVSGGNQICLCLGGTKMGQVCFWDHEDERQIVGEPENDFGNIYLIAHDFESLVEMIRRIDETPAKPGVIESKTWLDF